MDPLEQFEIQLQTIEECFRNVFSMPNLSKLLERQKNSDDQEDIEHLYKSILCIFEDTLRILVAKDLYKLQILREMIIWMNANNRYLQERVMTIISKVIKFSRRKIQGYKTVDIPCMGHLAAELAVLCSHKNLQIVIQASIAMYHLLCIIKFQNVDVPSDTSAEVENCLYFVPFDKEFTPKLLQKNNEAIAKYVGDYLKSSLLDDFVFSLLKKLPKYPSHTSTEASALLKLILEMKGDQVIRVARIVDFIHTQLNANLPIDLKQTLLQIIALLTRSVPQKVVFQLLDYMLPVDRSVLKMWKAVSTESKSSCLVLKTILIVLKGKPGEVEESSKIRKRFSLDTANMMPVVAAQALCILLPVPEYKKAIAQFFPQLLIDLILQLHYNCEQNYKKNDNTQRFPQNALRILLRSSGLENVDSALNKRDCWNQFSSLTFHHYGVYLIARTLSEFNFPQLPETLHYLYKLSVEGPRRKEDSVTTVIFLIELLNNFFKDPFPEEFLALFKIWVNDPNSTVSKLSLQKISTMAPVINQIKNIKELLLCIVDALPSKDKTVIIQAMTTLRKLLSVLDKVTYSIICMRIASSYYSLMDHETASIRAMAFRHFGDLLKDMKQYTWMLKPAVIKCLVPLLLFLEDSELRVVKACKYTLNICAPYFKWKVIPLLQDNLYNYEIVVLNICNCLYNNFGSFISDIIFTTLGFLKSDRGFLRKAAIIFLGYMAKMGSNVLVKNEIWNMIDAIEKVLHDEEPSIKQMADVTYMLFMEVLNELKYSGLKQKIQRLCSPFQFKNILLLYNYKGRGASISFFSIEEYAINTIEKDEEENLSTLTIPSKN
ncbi:maestro heat-like repeat-containing protein family member 9 isoform X2 [Monodelphis domestica]|nr:maestro heat-like repeat-containing protein family member 9 isoform X2 [Monodelphis domestica]